jgi:uncharacterized protein
VSGVADPVYEPFWAATAEGGLRVQECEQCGTRRWPPRVACANCASESTRWVAVEGRGRVYSWVVVHRTGLDRSVPYTVLIVELDEAPQLRFVGGLAPGEEDATIAIGTPVRASLHSDEDGRTRPYWSVV